MAEGIHPAASDDSAFRPDAVAGVTRAAAREGRGAPGDGLGRIFLLSHMRAFTSLAGHVLGSHPEISGYYELGIGYEERAALVQQRTRFLEHDVIKPGSRWLFDKLLHDEYRLLPDRLAPTPLKLLVSLRAPAQTLGSILRLFSGRSPAEPYAVPDGAAGYYLGRLRTLAGFASGMAGRYAYFDAELWQADPERLLVWLGHWLELSTPLDSRYCTFSQTGKRGRGDSSSRIHSGRIDRRRHDYSQAGIPAALLERAETTYRSCRAQLVAQAGHVLTL